MKIQIANSNALESINKIRKAITEDTTSGHNLADIGEMEIKKTDKQITFIYKLNNEVIGYVSVHENNVLNCTTDAMFEIFVHPNYQGQGIGKELYQYTEKYFKENMNYKRLILGVLNKNKAAIRFYESLGFKAKQKDTIGQYMVKKTP